MPYIFLLFFVLLLSGCEGAKNFGKGFAEGFAAEGNQALADIERTKQQAKLYQAQAELMEMELQQRQIELQQQQRQEMADGETNLTGKAQDANDLKEYLRKRYYMGGWGEKEETLCHRLAAEEGDAVAQYLLGHKYYLGLFVPQDYTQAREWFLKAATQGKAGAQFYLGVLFGHGWGVPQDYVQAREWYLKAAAQGEPVALHNLGVMYAKGRGVPQDYVQAHMWFNLAAASGWTSGEDRDLLAKSMTPAHVAEAQQLAREWQIQHPDHVKVEFFDATTCFGPLPTFQSTKPDNIP